MERIDADDEVVPSLELGAVTEVFESDRFPITTEELIAEYGDCEIGYPNGSERLDSVLETSGMETYETPDEVELAILNGVGREAVGRPRYSDRGDEVTESTDRSDQSL